MKLAHKILAAAATAAGLTLAFAAPASAYIVCNREGDCWHTDSRYARQPGVTFSYHPDDWYFHRDWDRDRDMRWRSERHDGRGYWRGGVWITLP
jgi:hypothetical protein